MIKSRAHTLGTSQTGRDCSVLRPLSARAPSAVPAADRLHAKDLAALEGCSISTAGALIRSGRLGPVHGRNRRDRWVDRLNYQTYLDKPDFSTAKESRTCTGRRARRNGATTL